MIDEKGNKLNTFKPIFIVGNGRSGTTMLGEILTAAKIGKSFEGHFVVKALQKYGHDPLSEKQLSELIALIEGFESTQCFNIKLNASNYINSDSVNAKDIILDALEAIAKASGSGQWIEKTPNYVYHIGLILEHFPEAKIIWMVRDGRDVAHSVFQKSWGANNIFYAAKAWNDANGVDLDKSFPQVLKVKYEEFLTEPELELTRVIEFLECESSDINTLVNKVNPGKMNRWRKTLSPHQIRVFESLAFDTLKMHRYPVESPEKRSISSVTVLFYKLDHHIKLSRHLVNENIVKPIKIKMGLLKPFSESN